MCEWELVGERDEIIDGGRERRVEGGEGGGGVGGRVRGWARRARGSGDAGVRGGVEGWAVRGPQENALAGGWPQDGRLACESHGMPGSDTVREHAREAVCWCIFDQSSKFL